MNSPMTDSTNAKLLEVLNALVDEKCDYMRINNLGDPEQTHTIKWARQVMIDFNKQSIP